MKKKIVVVGDLDVSGVVVCGVWLCVVIGFLVMVLFNNTH